MKRNRVRLTESQLHRVIKESVKKVLREMDITSMPLNADANGRNTWWKTQVDTDFPNHGIESSKDWQSEYSTLSARKEADDKAAAKQAKADARTAKADAMRARRQERLQTKQNKESAFERAFGYIMQGDENDEMYDSLLVTSWPVVVKSLDTNERQVINVNVDSLTYDGYLGSTDNDEDVQFIGDVTPNGMKVISNFKVKISGDRYLVNTPETNNLISKKLTNATLRAMKKI